MVGKKYKLPVLSPVGPDGKFTQEAGERFSGKYVLGDGTEAVLDIFYCFVLGVFFTLHNNFDC